MSIYLICSFVLLALCISMSYKYICQDMELRAMDIPKDNYQRKPIRRKGVYWLLGAIPFAITFALLL